MTRTYEEVKDIVTSMGYIFLDTYYPNNKKIRNRRVIIKDEIGYKYDVVFSDFIKYKNPRFIEKNNPFSLENISLWLKLNKKSFELTDGNSYLMNKVKLFFRCKVCTEIFDTRWNDVFSDGADCPFCSGRRVGRYNNLACTHSFLLIEWNYKKNKIKPEEITYGSKKRVWWICKNCGYDDWFASPKSKTSESKQCFRCAQERRESRMAYELKKYFIKYYEGVSEYKTLRNPDTNRWLPYDLYLPKHNFFIEIHGGQHYKLGGWHSQNSIVKGISPQEEFEYQKKKDKMKRKFARKNGVYIEIDIRKFDVPKKAIEYIEKIINKMR